MPTLTETAYNARRIIRYSFMVVAGYILLQFIIVNGVLLYKYLFPPPPEPPTVGFGMLPAIVFPSHPGYSYQFELQTPTGALPAFANKIAVYYMPYQRASLLALDQAKVLATKIGFASQPVELTSDTYRWNASIPAPLTLTNNIIDGSFILSYQWQADTTLQTQKKLPSDAAALQMARSFFEKLNQVPEDINWGQGKISYLKASGNRLVSAISLSEADFIKLDYFRLSVAEAEAPEAEAIPVLTPASDQGIISMILSGAKDPLKQIIAVEYDYFPVNYSSKETYPLKPVATAWEELVSGKAFFAKAESEATTVTIRRVTLAYFDSKEAQQFLQPIYVFRGDDGTNKEFVAYVPAVDNSQIIDK